MNVVVEIEGYKALPVWVLPYITSWKLSPDMLMDRLVNPHYDYPRLPFAFTLDDNGEPSTIPSLHWGEIANEIRSLDNKLSDKEQSEYDDRKEWRKCSIEEIKQYKAYIWLDEFEKWFYRSPNFCQESWIDEIDGTLKTQPVELCLNPLLPPELEHFFENHKPRKLTEAVPVTQNEELKPWLIADPKDPQPVQPWYIPARYFARQLIENESTLLTKRNLLADKVVKSLTKVGIKKRGGKKPFESSTVLKAFSNIDFS